MFAISSDHPEQYPGQWCPTPKISPFLQRGVPATSAHL